MFGGGSEGDCRQLPAMSAAPEEAATRGSGTGGPDRLVSLLPPKVCKYDAVIGCKITATCTLKILHWCALEPVCRNMYVQATMVSSAHLDDSWSFFLVLQHVS